MRSFLLLLLLFSFANAGGTATDEKLGAMVPLNLKFINDEGEEKTIKQLMDGKPTLLSLNYYKCAGVCTTELADLADTLTKVDLQEGKDYQVLTVSFSESETPYLAKEKRRTIFRSMTRPFTKSAWNFVVSKNGSSKKLVDAVGFNFEKSDLPSVETQYTHGTGLIVLSPEGKITRYLRGIHQLPIDVKMAVLDAAKGRVTPTIPKQLQSCSDFHPKEEYVLPVEQIVGAIITLIVVAMFIRLLLTGKKHKGTLTKEEYYRQEEEKENHSQKKDNDE
ncbi:MAG: SCO family protein [Thiovulaceae bacterium]|nr:SCO family protein [Sulfurimonadaceae bacterium]